MPQTAQRTQPVESFSRLCATRRTRFKDKRHHALAETYWPQVIRVDRMSRDELLDLQRHRLQELVEHAAEHVPFYRQWAKESGFSRGDAVELESLPIVSKADYIRDMEAFQSDAFRPDELSTFMTSGSSGQPFRLRAHRSSIDYSYCCLWRSLHRFGLRPGHRRAYLWGRRSFYNSTALKILKAKARYRARDWFNNTVSIDAYTLNDRSVAEAMKRIEAFRPVYLHGYVSALYTIARRLNQEGRTYAGLGLKAAVTESEKLYPFQREAMERAFACPVLEHYGSIEMGNMAQPAPDGRLRINEDMVLLERQPDGQAVITNLFSHAFPFIRYRQGDLVEGLQPAQGGLPYAVLDGVIGRTVDLIPLKAGGATPGRALTYIIDPHLDRVVKYQIHQRAVDDFRIKMVLREPLPQTVEQKIRADMTRLLGPDTRIEFEAVDEIPPAPSGKFRWIITDVPTEP